MFEQNRPYQIEFQLPEAQIGKTTHIRNLEFDARGIHTFVGLLPDYENVRRYLANFGVLPLQTPDTATRVERPVPRGIGKVKVANVAGLRDDLDDLTEFKANPDGAADSPSVERNREPATDQRSGTEAARVVRHGSGAGPVESPATRVVPASENSLGTEAEVETEVSAEDFSF